MRSMPLLHTGFIALLAGCASRTTAPLPVPADPAALEARRAAHPNDPRVLTDVGVAYYRAGDLPKARDVLSAALALDPSDTQATIHLGLVHEGLGEPEQALAAYRSALAHATDQNQKRNLEASLAVLTRRVLLLEARRAIATEQSLSTRVPAPNTVAVLPWTYLGADSALMPLERGLSHLVITDLAKVSRLTLLERDRVQAIADELALTGAGRTDSATAARSGRLLGAADVVQGAIRETGNGDLRLDANVVSATTASVRATGSASDKLSRLFAMEKSVVFDLLDRWGISLTPAERRAITEQPTADLQAFLAFSRGLTAEDRGDFAQAGVQYQQAIGIDPSFRMARERSAHSARTTAAAGGPAAQLTLAMTRRAATLRSAQLGAALQNIAPTLAGRLSRTQLRTVLALRSRLAEALRQDDPLRLGTLTTPSTIIPRP